MINKFKKIDLAFLPTPIHKLEGLTKLLKGPEIYMKRDDQTGLALGGNKTRKLEYILGHALETGVDCIITGGAAQSNHCRQTAAACAKLGMECHLVLGGEKPESSNGNLLLDELFKANIHWAGNKRKGEDFPKIEAELRASGKNPLVVPYGGSNFLGAISYIAATKEMIEQADESFTHIAFASSSGGTHAGLMVGKVLYEQDYEVLGLNIDKSEMQGIPVPEFIIRLANETAENIGLDYKFNAKDMVLNQDYYDAGYGVVTQAEVDAIELLAQTEGVLMDPVYTGRAMAGLIDLIKNNYFKKSDKVLFWHTGGAPALFSYAQEFNKEFF
jgi:L-cysteate sulfo-lyase